jgi:hypothetical protein
MFEQHAEWWDVLCDIKTGKVTLGAKIADAEAAALKEYGSQDNAFFETLSVLVEDHYGEAAVRQHFAQYTQRLLNMALNEEEFPDEATKRTAFDANRLRLESIRKTTAFQQYFEFQNACREVSSLPEAGIARAVRRLRECRNLPDKEVLGIYQMFQRCIT